MIRQLILSAVAATATLTGVTATAEAAPPIPVAFDRGHDHDQRGWGRFEVLQRHRGHWDSVGVYRDREQALRVARQIERRGGDAQVRRLDGRR